MPDPDPRPLGAKWAAAVCRSGRRSSVESLWLETVGRAKSARQDYSAAHRAVSTVFRVNHMAIARVAAHFAT
jgi:hypothetical protein